MLRSVHTSEGIYLDQRLDGERGHVNSKSKLGHITEDKPDLLNFKPAHTVTKIFVKSLKMPIIQCGTTSF